MRAGIFLIFLAVVNSAWAQNPAPSSILLDPPSAKRLALYSRPFSQLNESQQWHIKIHGLRLAALHPSVWSPLKRERTQNRRLVPIKRFFLRASEDSKYRMTSIRLTFQFKAAEERYMERMPHQKDPVFEIGFGGKFKENTIAEKPIEDRAYALRLSAFQPLRSGLFERNQERFTLLAPVAVEVLEVGKNYDLELRFSGDNFEALLNGTSFVRYAAQDLSQGLVSLQTSWHPIVLRSLSVRGIDSHGRVVDSSGLVETVK